ncbi:hypothetical protein, partial [Agrobacterium vitis]|uniref:hypothetical protein n=1 Tax=Agrobacterium vitis TaxID=373 RepID=UPI00203612CA
EMRIRDSRIPMYFDTRKENEQEPESLMAAKSPTPYLDISTHSRQDHRAGAGEGKGREGKGRAAKRTPSATSLSMKPRQDRSTSSFKHKRHRENYVKAAVTKKERADFRPYD